MSNTQKIIKIFTRRNVSKTLNINLKQNEESTTILYIIANNCSVKIKINFVQKSNSIAYILCSCIANNKSKIDVSFSNKVDKTSTNCVVKQQVNGIILDNESSITALPSLLIGNNNIKADHEVNIGGINKENLFYLMSRGIKEQDARKILINQLFNKAKENEYIDLLI
jgi:Fe-S cluster assembly scaffold protein SufB